MFVLLVAFIIMKVAFMLYNADNNDLTFSDYIDVIANGFSQDLTTISYLAIFPWLICVISIWVTKRWLNRAVFIYCCIFCVILSFILIGDCILYSFWQFKLDATIFNYLDSTNNITANISTTLLVVSLILVGVLSAALLFVLYRVTRAHFTPCKHKIKTLLTFLVFAGCMFLMIRGGVGRSTMNTGHAYFSSNQFLNHSAVNPAFSLFYSMFKYKDINKLYNYYTDTERQQHFNELRYSTQSQDATLLLNTRRPNVVLILMEGLGASFVRPLGGNPATTPYLNRFCQEGVLFSHCYANSYRTDRGTVCTLSGYPAFPDFSVMKMTEKSIKLPSIARSLSGLGYSTSYLYGGDKNFTNANSYLLATGYTRVMGEEHFPSATRKTHSWGVTDYIVLDSLYNQIVQHNSAKKPFFITCQTLASHENWIVPYHRIPNDPKANSMAYLDNCIGKLVARLRKTPVWNNLLLILIPDHGITYPEDITENNIQKYHIPIIWIGGAVKQPQVISQICNQTDLPATLLGQMNIDHSNFTFSRDVLSKTYTNPCAFHMFNRGVSFIDTTGVSIEDLTSEQVIVDKPTPSKARIAKAHSFLQTSILDLYRK